MDGLAEVPGRSTSFDKPEGRIVETSAIAVSPDIGEPAIRVFYTRILPQLGWQQAGKNSFIRQDEILTMQTGDEGGFATLRLLIAPR